MTKYLRTNKKREKVIEKATDVVVGEHTVTFEPCEHPDGLPGSHCHSVSVNGVHRGYAVRRQEGYLGGNGYKPPSWWTYSLRQPLEHYGTGQRRAFREYRIGRGGAFLLDKATIFAEGVDQGDLPTQEEVDQKLKAADEENAARKRGYAEAKEREEQKRREDLARVEEWLNHVKPNTLEGLQSIHDRLGDQLTNFEKAALMTAIARL